MANFKSKQVTAGVPALTSDDAYSEIVPVGEYVTKTGDAIGDIVEMGAIPYGTIVTDLIVHTGALGASATLDAGILSGNYGDAGTRTMGSEFFAGQAAATASLIRCNKSLAALTPSATSTSFGIKFAGANPAPGQTIRVVAYCRPAPIAM